MTTTVTENPLCPNGCGARVNPRGRGPHNRICPKLHSGPVDENATIVARLRRRRNELWTTIGGKLQDAKDALPEEPIDAAQYANVHQAVEAAHEAFGAYQQIVDMLDGKES